MHALPSKPWLASPPAAALDDDYSNNSFPCSVEPKIILLSMLAALLCLICFVLLYAHNCRNLYLRLLGRRQRATGAEASAGSVSYFNLFSRVPPPVGLPPRVINLLPSFLFGDIQQPVQQQQQWLECPVCLSRFEADDLLRLLPRCRHAFHALCVDKWLASKASCPLCRCLVSVNEVLNLQPAAPKVLNLQPADSKVTGAQLEVIIEMDRSLVQEQPSPSSSSTSSCTEF